MEQDVIEYHPDEYGGFYTTFLFWECGCDEPYNIHPFTQESCLYCGDRREDGPDAHILDVLRRASEIDKELLAQLEETLEALGLDIYANEVWPAPAIAEVQA